MNSKQAKWLARNPRALIGYQTQRKLPRTFRPDSPLIQLLESMSPRARLHEIRGIRLSPSLGYQTSLEFENGELLYRWLKPMPEMIQGEAFPAEQCRIKSFDQGLSMDDLRLHCTHFKARAR